MADEPEDYEDPTPVHRNESTRDDDGVRTVICGAAWSGALVTGNPKRVTCPACKGLPSETAALSEGVSNNE